MQQRFDEHDRLVHDSCGILINRHDGKLLLFKRTKYPYLLTIPAGHMEVGEQPMPAATREAQEEVGFCPDELELAYEGGITGDSCLGGADIHYWYAYTGTASPNDRVRLDEEGSGWGWYRMDELNENNTVMPVLHLLRQETVRKRLGAG